MKAVIQRANYCKINVDQQEVVSAEQSLVVLLGISKESTQQEIAPLINKIIRMRVFSDNNDKFDLSLDEIKGTLVIIPQFTLFANTNQGRRPSFFDAMPPKEANVFFELVKSESVKIYPNTQFGIFGADMKVSLENDGPVTIIL